MPAASLSVSGPHRAEKRILYHGGSRARFDALVAAMAEGSDAVLARSLGQPTLRLPDDTLRFLATHDVDAARDQLATRYLHLVLVDLCAPLLDESAGARCAAARHLLTALDEVEDRELRYGFHRIVVLLPDDPDPRFDELLIELGRLGVRHVARMPAADAPDPEAAGRLLRRIVALVDDRDLGPMALLANGGGITGIYFELGALKCLDDCLGPGAVNEFDSFYGISAGAVVTSMLAVGYTVDEIMAAIAGVHGGRIAPLSLSVMRLGHLNVRGNLGRWRRAAISGLRAVAKSLRDRSAAADELLLEWTSLIGAPFQSSGFERILRGVLEAPHGTNRFGDLPRPLYVGATDQDARRAVLFGEPGFDQVPISQAVQASLSINPAFGGVRIGDRYYEDGAVARTSNYVEAIRHGARLLFVLDPFVPYVSKRAGGNDGRGMLYNLDQDVRTLSFTRFESVRDQVLRDVPEVSSYTFLPANSQRKLLSANPMDHRPYLAIWRAAYLSTLQRVQQLEHRLVGDLAARGRSLDLSRAIEVARRLRHRGRIGLADFYPEGRLEIRSRPLVRAESLVGGAVMDEAAE